MSHIPVLLDEVIAGLNPQPGQTVFDGTLGFGGHAKAIISQIGPEGRYIGFDQDPAALAHCKAFLPSPPTILVHRNFEAIAAVARELGIDSADGILADLGISSFQLDHPDRGFSFQREAPLDLRMNSESGITGADFLNTATADELKDALSNYTDLRHFDRFIDDIVSQRKSSPIITTTDLVNRIKRGFYFRNSRSRYINTCQQVFQAVRMAVNRELEVIPTFIESAKDLLKPGGRLAIITFHSIEDRIVKHTFERFKSELSPVNKKVIRASQSEIRRNRRSKSAKLRVVEKKGPGH